MPNWNNLTSKVIQTVEADGILGLGKRGGRYLKKVRSFSKKESEPVLKMCCLLMDVEQYCHIRQDIVSAIKENSFYLMGLHQTRCTLQIWI